MGNKDVQCPDCDGIDIFRGIFETYGNGRCSSCHGSGHDRDAEFLVGFATLSLEEVYYPCKECSGTGQFPMCGGTGRIWVAKDDDYGEDRNEKSYQYSRGNDSENDSDYVSDYDYDSDSQNQINNTKKDDDDDKITIHEVNVNGKLVERYYTIKGERYEVDDKRLLSNSREFTHDEVTLIYVTLNGKEFLFDIKIEKD